MEPSLSIPSDLSISSSSQATGSVSGGILPLRVAEELILTLPGVLSVRIVPSDAGVVDEIHVLTTDRVLPKHTVRNIESALMAQLGMRVNHRKISIATTIDAQRAADLPPIGEGLEDADTIFPSGPRGSTPRGSVETGSAVLGVAGAMPRGGLADMAAGRPTNSASARQGVPAAARGVSGSIIARGELMGAESALRPTESSTIATSRTDSSPARRMLVFEDVEMRRSRARGVSCLVTLSRSNQEFVGEAEGQDGSAPHVDLAARAAVRAILAARGTPENGRGLAVEGVRLLEAFDRQYVFVSIAARMGREPVVLTGSCEVRESAETSAVLAVLDATNRWLHFER